MQTGIITNRVLLGSIEVLRKGEKVEIVQSTQKKYLIRKIGVFEILGGRPDHQ